MTIARRLIILLAVPIAALLGLGVFLHFQMDRIETRTRFVIENQMPGVATVGNITRNLSGLRVQMRDHLLATNAADQAEIRASFEKGESELSGLLRSYADGLISDERDRRILNEFLDLYHEWRTEARRVMVLAGEGRREEAAALLQGEVGDLGRRINEAAGAWIKHNEELATETGRMAKGAVADTTWKWRRTNDETGASCATMRKAQSRPRRGVAQLVEHPPPKWVVAGSNPATPAMSYAGDRP